MKRFIIVLAVLVHISTVSVCNAADELEALKSFQPILNRINQFFSNNPKLLVKISPPNQAETAYFITHFLYRGASYDILATNSIVTPYRAFVDLTTDVLDNKPCGDISFEGRDRDGWRSPDTAQQFTDTQRCYYLRTRESGPIINRFVFLYKALDKQWTLNEIQYEDGQPNGRLLALLGVATPWFPKVEEPQVHNFNKSWHKLFDDLK